MGSNTTSASEHVGKGFVKVRGLNNEHTMTVATVCVLDRVTLKTGDGSISCVQLDVFGQETPR